MLKVSAYIIHQEAKYRTKLQVKYNSLQYIIIFKDFVGSHMTILKYSMTIKL
jgi:hypothetical protein